MDICFCGPPASFKSSAAGFFAQQYDATWSPRYNELPYRPGYPDGEEYVFGVKKEDFDSRLESGFLLDWPEARGQSTYDGIPYRRGTVHPRYWPIPAKPDGHRVMVLGPRAAWKVQQNLARGLKLVYLDGSPDILAERVLNRKRGGEGVPKETVEYIEEYQRMGLPGIYDKLGIRVITDKLCPQEVVEIVVRKLGLEPSLAMRRGTWRTKRA